MRIRPSSFRERPKTTAAVAAEVDAEKGRIERHKIRHEGERERKSGRKAREGHKSRLVVPRPSSGRGRLDCIHDSRLLRRFWMETKAKSSEPRRISRGEVWLVVSDARGNSSLGTEIWECGESWARSPSVSPVTHRVTAAAAAAERGRDASDFERRGWFWRSFWRGEGGFNEAGPGSARSPSLRSYIHPSGGSPRRRAATYLPHKNAHLN